MAEETKVTEVTENEVVETEQVVDEKPTYEELLKQLEEKDKEYSKLKTSFDKASSDLAAKKKELRERMSSDEVAEEEKLATQKKLAIYEAIDHYTEHFPEMDMATARKLAELDANGDKGQVADVMREFMDALVKQKSTEALLGRQRVNASANATAQITKEQFSAMSPEDRTKLYRENQAEYDRLKSLI